jgi:pyruvate/2-oxoglutarate dehydrogenase complex dihydrolipoamide acyltransferase (E2) component
MKDLKVKNTEIFGIQRKIVANMTTESWETIPHVSYLYEPDVTAFFREFRKMNEGRAKDDRISVNTLMLKVIAEGLKRAPVMNSHMEYKRGLVRGKLVTYENINISMPTILPDGSMMTLNIRDIENKNLDDISEQIKDSVRRANNTDMNEVMFEVSLDNTLNALRHGQIRQTILRLIGSKTGKNKVKTLHGHAKRRYLSIPENDRLTKRDLEQGTVTISNIGSTVRGVHGEFALLEIVPPQVTVFGIAPIQDRPAVINDEISGEKSVGIRQVIPICIAFDHRAIDFGDIVPFLKCLDGIFADPEIIYTWREKRN